MDPSHSVCLEKTSNKIICNSLLLSLERSLISPCAYLMKSLIEMSSPSKWVKRQLNKADSSIEDKFAFFKCILVCSISFESLERSFDCNLDLFNASNIIVLV